MIRQIHTIKHLKAKQIFFRLFYGFARRKFIPPSEYEVQTTNDRLQFLSKSDSQSIDGTFCFLGKSTFFENGVDWNFSSYGLLWNYNLNYFNYINSAHKQDNYSLELIKSWCRFGLANHRAGMDPYPTSIRIVNWIKFNLTRALFTTEISDCLYQQCQYLSNKIEYHILANHLIANAKALVFAGVYFNNKESMQWFSKGMELLNLELEEQILPDGAHFERSPMYHCSVLEDLLDLYVLLRNTQPDTTRNPTTDSTETTGSCEPETKDTTQNDIVLNQLKTNIENMLHWLARVTHPDGQITFFNDSAFDIANNPGAIVDFASSLDLISSERLLENSRAADPRENSKLRETTQSLCSGLNKSTRGAFTLFTNIAPIEPRYQPSHAHADTLSFELSIYEERFLVNSGTSTYAIDELRAFQRSTSAHNTVEIEDKNSSDVWSSFRVGKKAAITDYSVTDTANESIVSGSHNGYSNFFSDVQHNRQWNLTESGLTISDTVSGSFKNLKIYFYFHPCVTLLDAGYLKTRSGHTIEWQSTESNVEWRNTYWYPRFGEKIPNLCLVISTSKQCVQNQLTLAKG